MTNPTGRILSSFFSETLRYVKAIEANLDLLAFVVRDVLTGSEPELQQDEEDLAKTLDAALYQCSLSALDTLEVLQQYVPTMAPDELSCLAATTKQYEDLTNRWKEMMQGLHEAWKLRRPPH